MDERQTQLREQIQRCRRLASVMTDDEVRHALEDLAEEYEDRLAAAREPFMLRGREEDSRRKGGSPARGGEG